MLKALLVVVALLTLPLRASAGAIEILSSDYHIWGEIGANVWTGATVTPTLRPYDLTGTHPLTYADAFLNCVSTTASADAFQVSAYSGSNWGTLADGTQLFPTLGANYANAAGDWTFQPDGSTLDLLVSRSSSLYASAQYALRDLTSGQLLASGIQGAHFSLDVDPAHRYGLSLLASANSHDDHWTSTMGVTMQAVPEPATGVLLLLGLGTVWAQRRS